MEFLRLGLRIDLGASEFLVWVISEKVKKFMSKPIQYSDEPMGEIKLVADFLPSPAELALKNNNTKVTISLISESVSF